MNALLNSSVLNGQLSSHLGSWAYAHSEGAAESGSLNSIIRTAISSVSSQADTYGAFFIISAAQGTTTSQATTEANNTRFVDLRASSIAYAEFYATHGKVVTTEALYLEAEATSYSSNDRVAYSIGITNAEGYTEGFANRTAYTLDSVLTGFSDISFNPTVKRFVDSDIEPVVEIIEKAYKAVSVASTVEGVVYTTSQNKIYRNAHGSNESDAATFATADVDKRALIRIAPARAIAWIAEGAISKIRINRVTRGGNAIARAITRLLPNSAIGMGSTESTAFSSVDTKQVYVERKFDGKINGEGLSEINSALVRIINVGMVGTAESVLAPTITRNGINYSYFYGKTVSESISHTVAGAIRRFGEAQITESFSNAETLPYSVIKHGKGNSTSISDSMGFYWTWKYISERNLKLAANANVAINTVTLRNVYFTGEIEGTVTTTSLNKVLRTTDYTSNYANALVSIEYINTKTLEGINTLNGNVESIAVNKVYREAFGVKNVSAEVRDIDVKRHAYFSSSIHSTAYSTLTAFNYVNVVDDSLLAESDVTIRGYKIAGMSAIAECFAILNAEFTKYSMFYSAPAESEAYTTAQGLRIVNVTGETKEGIASAMRFVFQINMDGSIAPSNRTINVRYADRAVIIPKSDREYLIK